jgi:7-cyano-7-deazaguanine reductase
MQKVFNDVLNAITSNVANNSYVFGTEHNPKLLERFAACTNESVDMFQDMWIHIRNPEFTCLCPATGQPDFATIDIFYKPNDWCVESKSLKLYLMSFRNVGSFHERVTATILKDLEDVLCTEWCLVTGLFLPRGGIPFHPRAYQGSVPRELLYRV